MLDLTNFKITTVLKKEDYAKIEISPLPKGYGNTIGVPLRRVLLSSLEGAAITEVKISGIKHEYTTMTGVKEDVLRIIFNLKEVIFQPLTTKKTHTLTLSVKGKKIVTAADIKTDGEVEVVNPEQKIAELTATTAKLDMELTVETGVGYRLADDEKRTKIGLIPVDANFSPLERVSITRESTRVGQETDLDKLVIEMWTRTHNSAEDLLNKAAKILLTAFTSVVDQTGGMEKSLPEEKPKAKKKTTKSK